MEKIVILSQCKNATTSLAFACKRITGFSQSGWVFDPNGKFHKKFSGNSSKDISLIFDEIDRCGIIHDDPFAFYYDEIIQKYPDAKYILSYRKSADWYKSFANDFWVKWKGQYKIKQNYYGKDISDKEHLIDVYEKTNKSIIEYTNNKYICINFYVFIK